MAFFEWTDRLDVGVPTMNDEHKTLIAIMNELHDRHAAKAPRAELRGLLHKLANYTAKHFADEERYLASIDYPDLEVHRGVHQNLLEKVKGHVDAFDAGGPLTDELFEFLRFWLRAHIAGIDQRYRPDRTRSGAPAR